MIQYMINGEEYTTRYKLAGKYNLSKHGGVVQEILSIPGLVVVQDRNQYYFLKSEIEPLFEERLNRRK